MKTINIYVDTHHTSSILSYSRRVDRVLSLASKFSKVSDYEEQGDVVRFTLDALVVRVKVSIDIRDLLTRLFSKLAYHLSQVVGYAAISETAFNTLASCVNALMTVPKGVSVLEWLDTEESYKCEFSIRSIFSRTSIKVQQEFVRNLLLALHVLRTVERWEATDCHDISASRRAMPRSVFCFGTAYWCTNCDDKSTLRHSYQYSSKGILRLLDLTLEDCQIDINWYFNELSAFGIDFYPSQTVPTGSDQERYHLWIIREIYGLLRFVPVSWYDHTILTRVQSWRIK